MNNARRQSHTICTLPARIALTFGKSGAPSRPDLRPVFRKRGQTRCLAKPKVVEYSEKVVTVELPESLACQGPGRYELLLHDACCRECDSVDINFEAKCEIIDCSVKEIEEDCDVC